MVWWWVLGLGFRVCTRAPLVGMFRVEVCEDMRGFRVEGQQLGAGRPRPCPGECRHFGHATKLHSFNSHNIREDPGFGGPSLRLLAR